MERQMLADKVALIAGASYGIGENMAEFFADEGASFAITARGRNKPDKIAQKIRNKGGKAIGIVAYIGSREDTVRICAKTLKEYGDFGILIKNAALGEQKTIDDTFDEWMQYIMNINLADSIR